MNESEIYNQLMHIISMLPYVDIDDVMDFVKKESSNEEFIEALDLLERMCEHENAES